MKIKEFHGQRFHSVPNQVRIIYADHPARLLVNQAPERSPDGFEWGYGGSGPFALAKSILHEINPKLADAMWLVDAFKWNIIALLSDDEWTLTSEQIENFIAMKLAGIDI